MGHSLLYRYGLFKQNIVNGDQKEEADEWLSKGHIWLNEKKEKSIKVNFGGRLEEFVDYYGTYHYKVVDPICVEAIPCDLVMSGYKLEGKKCNKYTQEKIDATAKKVTNKSYKY